MTNNFLPGNLSQIKNFYREAFQNLNKDREIPEIEVEFYPYIGINQTIRIRQGKILVRLAEITKDAPMNIQKALAYILTAKILRKKVPAEAARIYREFIKDESLREKATLNKKERGRKIITTSKGEIYDLDELFDKINRTYFQNSVPKTILTWSARKTFRILGHHDAAHQTIVISKSFDDKKVPRYVVEFVLFHEMLHIVHPMTQNNGRRNIHTPLFRRDEKKFKYYNEAENWIEQNAASLRRKARRKPARK